MVHVRRRDERGAVAVMIAALALVLFMLAALVVDLGLARETRREAQNTADAAVLAAANAYYASGSADKAAAVAAAKDFAKRNYGTTDSEWAACTDPGRPAGFTADTTYPCISFKSDEVRVVVPVRDVKTPLGALAGVSKVEVGAQAQAKVTPGGAAKCGLCIIGTGAHNFQNGDVTVQGANIYINGTTDNGPQSTVWATTGGAIYLQEACCNFGKGDYIPSPPYAGQPPIADPLAFLTLPPPEMSSLTAKTASACGTGSTHGPGIYKSLGLSGNCVLQPGLYVVTGPNHDSGQTTVTANGVTFYFACQDTSVSTPKVKPCTGTSSDTMGDLLLTGQASLTISPMTSGSLAGMSMVADRKSTAEFGFRGNGSNTSSGTIYAANGTFDYRGNGNGLALDSLVVVKDLDFSGAPSGVVLKYTTSANVKLPPGALNLSY